MKVGKRTRKQLIKLAFGLIIILVAWLWGPDLQQNVPPNLQAGTYRVVTVDDGDTIIVDMNGTEEKVRFIGVDTPETKDPRKPVQCFGYAAGEFTKELIGDNPVRLEADPTNTNRDRYGRLLRYVYLPDGTLINASIIEAGYGFAYLNFPVQKADEFRQLEKQARSENRGLWSGCKPTKNQYGGWDANPTN